MDQPDPLDPTVNPVMLDQPDLLVTEVRPVHEVNLDHPVQLAVLDKLESVDHQEHVVKTDQLDQLDPLDREVNPEHVEKQEHPEMQVCVNISVYCTETI